MATEVDRRAVATAARTPLSGWFVACGVLLVASLLAAFIVQARQQALLSQTVQGQDDYLVLNLFQLETEYLRLRERWRQTCLEARVEYRFATTVEPPAEVLRAFLFARQRTRR